jgi:FKBP-type peptidyl-prolyl cis-trans isomerase
VYVDYTGYLKDGTTFDSGTAVGFQVGRLISGFVYSMVDMHVGGTRYVVIPSDYGFGNARVNEIPPNSTLIFRIRLNSFVNTGT